MEEEGREEKQRVLTIVFYCLGIYVFGEGEREKRRGRERECVKNC